MTYLLLFPLGVLHVDALDVHFVNFYVLLFFFQGRSTLVKHLRLALERFIYSTEKYVISASCEVRGDQACKLALCR